MWPFFKVSLLTDLAKSESVPNFDLHTLRVRLASIPRSLSSSTSVFISQAVLHRLFKGLRECTPDIYFPSTWSALTFSNISTKSANKKVSAGASQDGSPPVHVLHEHWYSRYPFLCDILQELKKKSKMALIELTVPEERWFTKKIKVKIWWH